MVDAGHGHLCHDDNLRALNYSPASGVIIKQ